MIRKGKKLKSWHGYNAIDLILLSTGLITIVVTAAIFKSEWLVIVNSLLGILCVFTQAKGKIATQFIGVVWFVFYCFMAYQQRYYGETILYATVMIPLYVYGVIHWLAHRDKQDDTVIVKSEFSKKELLITAPIWLVAGGGGIFFLLRALHTAQLWLSTIAFWTMLPSVYLLVRRNKWNQILFLINDIVLCILWQTLLYKGSYGFVPILCYQIFQIIYDAYGMFEWWKLEKRQKSSLDKKRDEITKENCMLNFQEIKKKAKLLPDDEYDKLWDEFTKEGVCAKKLELLQTYDFIDGNEDFKNKNYDKFVEMLKEFDENASGGKDNVKRLHYIEFPLNPYLEMEYYTYLIGEKYGQDIRVTDDRNLFPSEVFDFVLFENGNLFLLDFGKNNDTWVGAWHVTDESVLKQVSKWFDDVYAEAENFKSMMKPNKKIVAKMKVANILK